MQSRVSSSRTESGDMVLEFSRIATTGTRQLATAVQAGQPLLEAYIALLQTAMALPMLAMSSFSSIRRPVMASAMPASCCDCEIPETNCPPECVCEIVWEGAPGDKLKAAIQLTNTRQVPQVFTLSAGPFKGPSGGTGAAVVLDQAAVQLPAGQSTTISVKFQVPPTFVGGSVYDSEVQIAGLYEQCVKVTLRVLAQVPDPYCDVKQGEIPTCIRAHRWYHHFQCEEPCFEPARKPDRPPIPATEVPH